jgi:hypothetical protein
VLDLPSRRVGFRLSQNAGYVLTQGARSAALYCDLQSVATERFDQSVGSID